MARWLPLAVAAAMTAAACGRSDIGTELALAPGNCTDTHFAEVSVVSVEVYGSSAGQLCVLRQRCVFNIDATSATEIGNALADVSQPLIDVEQSGAMVLAIIGHTVSCFGYDDQAMCGFADLADANDGTVDVELQCTNCPTDEIPFCP